MKEGSVQPSEIMTFAKETTVTPSAIAEITVELNSPDPTSDNTASARYFVHVRMSDGTKKVLAGDLAPHLTPAQINPLLAFMATLRTKAIAEILP